MNIKLIQYLISRLVTATILLDWQKLVPHHQHHRTAGTGPWITWNVCVLHCTTSAECSILPFYCWKNEWALTRNFDNIKNTNRKILLFHGIIKVQLKYLVTHTKATALVFFLQHRASAGSFSHKATYRASALFYISLLTLTLQCTSFSLFFSLIQLSLCVLTIY